MITKEDIQRFIKQIPPKPEVLTKTLAFVDAGELTKAARCAQEDLALYTYLKTLVNRPIYGFKNEVSDLNQIFGILGVSGAQQVLYSYMLSLLSPDAWEIFRLDKHLFYELQAKFSRRWAEIMKLEKIKDKEIGSAITLLPASIIVCEALFKSHKEDIALLRSAKALDYNTILKRLCALDLFDICVAIAKVWEMPASIQNIIQTASGIKPSDDPRIDRLGKWMHLLLFYEFSQPQFLEAGLNDFIDFQVDYVEAVYPEFSIMVGMQ